MKINEFKKTIKFFKKNSKLIVKTVIPVFLFCLLIIIIGIIIPKSNDNISPSNAYLFENKNPTFNVGFGNREDTSKSYVRFEAKKDPNNPFEETESNLWAKISQTFSKKQGIEFGLSDVKFSPSDSEFSQTLLANIGDAIEAMEIDNVTTDTEVIEVGRLLGEEDENNVSKQTVLNKNVYPGIDIEYQILEGLGVKEEIIIQSIEEYTSNCSSDSECLLPLNQFIFDLKLDEGLQLKESLAQLDGKTDTKYYITDQDDNYVAHFLPTFAVDRVGSKTSNVDLEIINKEDGNYKMSVTLDLDWLFSDERVFPIRIDPSIVHDTTTEFDTGYDYNTEVVIGPKVQLEQAEVNRSNTDLEGYWKMDDNILSITPTYSNLEGYWDFNESSGIGAYILDKSGNDNNGTPSGTTFTDGRVNGARSYNGSSDYIQIPNNSTLQLSSVFSFSGWIYRGTDTGGWERLMSKSDTTEVDYFMQISSDDKLHCGNRDSSATNNSRRSSASIPVGEWTYVACTMDSSYNWHTYINGELDDGLQEGSRVTARVSTRNLQFGRLGTGSTWYYTFQGKIDEFGIFSDELTSSEIRAIYKEGFDIMDSSSNTNNGMVYSADLVDGIVGNAYSFGGDSSGDYIDLGTDSSLKPTGALTVSAWVYPESGPSSEGRTVLSTYKYVGASENYGWNFGPWWTGNYFGFHVCANSTHAYAEDTTFFDEHTNEWVFVVGVYSPSQYIRVYVNGELTAETTSGVPSSIVYDSGSPTIIGRRSGQEQSYWDGNIDEVRVYSTSLGEDDIHRLYELGLEEKMNGNHTSAELDIGGRADITSITWSPVGNTTGNGEIPYSTTGLVGQWDFNETSGTTADNEGSCGSNCDGTLTGFSSTSGQDVVVGSGWTSDNRRWGDGALMFDGSSDYVSIPNDGNLSFERTDSFTLEGWFRTDGPIGTSTQTIVSKMNSSSLVGYDLSIYDNRLWFIISSTWDTNCVAVYVENVAVTDSRWHYVVATYDGTSSASGVTIYIDGISVLLTTYKDSLSSTTVTTTASAIGSRYGGAYFDGDIDSVRIYSRELTSSEIISNYQSGNIEMRYRTSSDGSTWSSWSGTETSIESFDDDYMYPTSETGLVAYYPMDESSGTTINDRAGSYNATASGSDIIDGKFGNARRFDGSSDYINTSADIDYGTGTAITVSAWFNYHNCTGADGICYIVSKGQYASGSAYTLLVTNTGIVRFAMMSTSVSSESGFDDGKWHYATAVLSGTTGYIYVDGHLQASGTLSPTNNNEYVIIGSDDASSTYRPFNGGIDEVEIYNVALTASDIYEKFLEGSSQSVINTKTAPLSVEGDNALEVETQYSFVDGNTAGYWHLDESSGSGAYILDQSYNGNDGTPSGTTYTADGKYNGARYFDGTDDTITTSLDTAADSLYAASGYTWTVECWFKYTSGLADDGILVGRGGGTGTSATFGIYIDTSNQLRAVIRGGYTTLQSNVNDGQWNHIALTWNGSNGYYYYNGVYGGSLSIGSASIQSHTVSFGATSSGTLKYFEGYLDEIKISDVARDGSEIRQSYRWGKGSYISQPITSSDLSASSILPFWFASDKLGNNMDITYGNSPYANYEPDSNTLGLWRFDEERTGSYTEDDSGYINHGTATGTTYTSDGVMGGAKIFNGSSDYVTVSSGIDLASSSFTIDAWAKRSSSGSYDFFITQGSATTNYGLHFGFRNTDTFTLAFWNSDLTTTETFTDGEWHYYSASYDASTNDRRIYVDGVLVANDTASGDYLGSGSLIIGARLYSTYYYFGGTLDEVRISDTVRSPEEIRQAYEVGKRKHPIIVDFKADLESSNLISSSGDTSFTINEQNYGTSDYIENIDVGEKIIVKETSSGTEYFAQGDIASVNTSTGAVTVDSWDAASTFPSGGYTTSATVFKWQREYVDIRYPLSDDIDAITNLTFKKNTDSIATFWIDDAQKAIYSSDYNASSFTSIDSVQYVQYQAIFTKWNDNTDLYLYLTEIEITYSSGPTMDQLMRHGKWFNSSGVEQPFWWVGN